MSGSHISGLRQGTPFYAAPVRLRVAWQLAVSRRLQQRTRRTLPPEPADKGGAPGSSRPAHPDPAHRCPVRRSSRSWASSRELRTCSECRWPCKEPRAQENGAGALEGRRSESRCLLHGGASGGGPATPPPSRCPCLSLAAHSECFSGSCSGADRCASHAAAGWRHWTAQHGMGTGALTPLAWAQLTRPPNTPRPVLSPTRSGSQTSGCPAATCSTLSKRPLCRPRTARHGPSLRAAVSAHCPDLRPGPPARPTAFPPCRATARTTTAASWRTACSTATCTGRASRRSCCGYDTWPWAG